MSSGKGTPKTRPVVHLCCSFWTASPDIIPREEGVSELDEESKFIAIDETTHHQIVYGRRLGKAPTEGCCQARKKVERAYQCRKIIRSRPEGERELDQARQRLYEELAFS